ncbi:hypothetical protein NRIC_17440 [Enterococcus florum]|uniref:DUF998 domain-containing protein n=1 Tax=Enterococcus florum TaxID=2480627 RepID=A0A4P5PKI8_9ENTE|nr:DUF998 domain-containing protein [Enterococcus florum]GCF93853.1 hypothetical protein NRIC_17440 [Enterococcus florum]
MRIIKPLFSLGMISSVVYLLHVFIGQALWPEYDPVSMDISSLTADGAPNAPLLRVFTAVYGVTFLLFVATLLWYAVKHYHKATTAGYGLLLIMALSTTIGYSLFPLTGNKTEMNFQNMMHIVVTMVVVFTTIAALFLLAYGYLKKEKNKLLGRICLSFSIAIFLFGALNPLSLAYNLGILGITERLVILTLQLFVFVWSYLFTFKYNKVNIIQ